MFQLANHFNFKGNGYVVTGEVNKVLWLLIRKLSE